MTRAVKLLAAARADLWRLADFLVDKNPRAAAEAARAIDRGVQSLSEFPERGRKSGVAGLRELCVRFGRDGYVIRYRVEDDRVLVTRVFHGLEPR